MADPPPDPWSMNVHVRFFASLRESLGRDEVRLDLPPAARVSDVWTAATGQGALPAGVLCAINHDYAAADAAVQPGDEVAFFPPVTGG